MLAFGLGRLDDEIDQAARDGDLPGRDGTSSDELLGLANDEATGVMRRLGDRQRVEGNRLFVQ